MLGTMPCSALFILFDFVIHNPSHPETETNLSLLDTAAGYFGRLQYATGGSFPAFLMSGFSQIASDFVRQAQGKDCVGSSATDLPFFVTSTAEPGVTTAALAVPAISQSGRCPYGC